MEEHMTGNDLQSRNRRYVIVHGHFYQPPRENPWLNVIESQPSAAPDHDWNERIYDQCYRPNAYSRLLDSQGMIIDISNNYQIMSFNFGPTLFSWLEQHHSSTAKRIIEADKKSAELMNGHGNGVAQVYNHIIMPLSSRRDQITQIRWSKYFFKQRFGRDPEGIWLAETAINMVTVNCLIEENIKFVILSPNQAESFRSLDGNSNWVNSRVDTRRTYRIFPKDSSGNLTQEGHLDVFFFDEGLSKEVSFGDLLKDSHTLGSRIKSCYDNSFPNQVVTIATDGETFGHHKPFGDMCLAYFFKKVAPHMDIIPINFGYYLELNPPQFEVSLRNAFGEGTAWSCAHGVGRWTRDCGCKTGGDGVWKQTWREPLRKSMEKLQKQIDTAFESKMSTLVKDPWAMRDKYIAIDKSSWKQLKELLETDSINQSIDKDQVFACMRLLEAQKYMLFAFTSCAWFFSEISGIETMQNMAYACRALQLGIPQEKQLQVLDNFLFDLGLAPSNLPNTTGRTLFERYILPFYNHDKVLGFTAAVHRALNIQANPIFELFGYRFQIEQVLQQKPGMIMYDGFIVNMENESTGEQNVSQILIAHRYYAEVTGWVIPYADPGKLKREIPKPEVWMGHPEAKQYTLMDLFQISRQDLENFILQKIARDTDIKFTSWMKKNELELDFLSRLNTPIPDYCTAPLSYVFQEEWTRTCRKMKTLGNEDDVFTELLELTRLAKQFAIKINMKESAEVLENFLVEEISNLSDELNTERCDRIRYLLNIVDRFKISVSKHLFEDIFHPVLYEKITHLREEIVSNSKKDDGQKNNNRELFIQLISFARRMNFNTDAFQIS